ncbi:MAG: site-specific DNA-methyltransferase [Lachnospiraceae bacterium]|nr:site-specific DNA-methyltransferase [Lachnospiraceae bacterium]
MALLHDLIQQIDDPALRERILQETDKLVKQKKFGLVFEEHLPECTPLYDVPIRVGSKVALKTGYVSDIYTVIKIEDGEVLCDRRETHEKKTFHLDELVEVAEFGEPIYPTLKLLDTVENAPDSDLWHILIEADNYHALQLLEYLYAEKVDCIYIDPPYNTGAKDWKYNNDYVDSSDAYRHSKWLSMMEKRLKIAKKLLNPKDSVLIVTIDEKEYLHLGCLLEELFPEANMQMISSVINPYGTQRLNEFSRNDEYIFFLMFGKSHPAGVVSGEEPSNQTYWKTFRRGDLASRRGQPKGGRAQFYPIYVDKKSNRIVKIGDPIAPEVDRQSVPEIEGCYTIFPLRDDGTEMNWCTRKESAEELLRQGYIKAGRYNENTEQKCPISYLRSGTVGDIKDGKLVVDGYDKDGSIIAHYVTAKEQMPQTNWRIKEHSARDYGTNLIRSIFIEKRFIFPKSLYAVRDCIDLFVRNKPDALVLDFFAGSGTTLHAVNLLNAKDNGNRRCIMVTNNEVSADEAKNMNEQGLKPGDLKWDAVGIARYVTWPRTICSIEGHDVNGKALKGKYLELEVPMADGFKTNAAFFKLAFLDKTSVALGRQFKELLPVFWMKGGAIGGCPSIKSDKLPEMLILPVNKMAILIDEIFYFEFDETLRQYPEINTIFIVTDSEVAYRTMIRTYDGKDCYQLYRDYLDNFRINTGR